MMPGKSSWPPWSWRRKLSRISFFTVLGAQPLSRNSLKVEGRFLSADMSYLSPQGLAREPEAQARRSDKLQVHFCMPIPIHCRVDLAAKPRMLAKGFSYLSACAMLAAVICL